MEFPELESGTDHGHYARYGNSENPPIRFLRVLVHAVLGSGSVQLAMYLFEPQEQEERHIQTLLAGLRGWSHVILLQLRVPTDEI
jgi:hypothetical protein